jgi:hypothetical protein
MGATSDTPDHIRRLDAAMRRVLPARASLRSGRGGGMWTINDERFVVKWVGEGRLAAVRELLALPEHPDIVVARVLSPGARAALSNAGVGWIDETGGAEIATPQLVISRTGTPPSPHERPLSWTPAAMAVAEALLCGVTPTVSATAAATGFSEGACTGALRTLASLGLIRSDAPRGRKSGRRVDDPGTLLDVYASAAHVLRQPTSLTVGATWQDPVDGVMTVGRKLDRIGLNWAATGFVAAAVAAPLITTISTAEVYLDAPSAAALHVAAANLGLRPIDGGRLTLRPFPTRTANLLATRENDLRIVPWPRLYADLREQGVRGEEAAEHVREVLAGS